MSNREYYYSEIFYSAQGEGKYTGHPTAWLRFFGCNLTCKGFGQVNPTDPSSYELPYEDVLKDLEKNPDKYKTLKDLPVFSKGCDSAYSWSSGYKRLQERGTAEQISSRIRGSMKSKYNPQGKFSFADIHMCFTGGEPLLKVAQKASCDIIENFYVSGDYPKSVTYETNGTQSLTEDFFQYWNTKNEIELFFSVSPKLYAVSGETKAVNYDVIREYSSFANGQLKFVVNGTQECWNELETHVNEIKKDSSVKYEIWVMPVGGTLEGQKGQIKGHKDAGQIAFEALERGYKICARVHNYLWGNAIGV